jgi:hypothetical protein
MRRAALVIALATVAGLAQAGEAGGPQTPGPPAGRFGAPMQIANGPAVAPVPAPAPRPPVTGPLQPAKTRPAASAW